jgi:hypothetical protein
VSLLFLQVHRETDLFFATSEVQFSQSNIQFHYHRVVFSSQLKSKVGHLLGKTEDLRINLNIDDDPIAFDHTLTLHTLKPLVSNLVSVFR